MLECVHKPACQKQLAFAHAVLGAWGSGHYLMVADVDEYLALPEKRAYFAVHCAATTSRSRADAAEAGHAACSRPAACFLNVYMLPTRCCFEKCCSPFVRLHGQCNAQAATLHPHLTSALGSMHVVKCPCRDIFTVNPSCLLLERMLQPSCTAAWAVQPGPGCHASTSSAMTALGECMYWDGLTET